MEYEVGKALEEINAKLNMLIEKAYPELKQPQQQAQPQVQQPIQQPK